MNLISQTIYSEYIKERLGQSILENENGFIKYKTNGEEIFIVDMYVKKELQFKGLGHSLLKSLNALAKTLGCKVITANVHLFDENKEKTLQSAFNTGFKIHSSNDQFLTILREVK